MSRGMRAEERGAAGGLWPASLGWLFVNRLQVVLYILVLPHVLLYPYMIWAIVIVGFLSHFNLRLLAGWLRTEEARLGYEGFVRLLGERATRALAVPGAAALLLDSAIVTLDYLEVAHHVLFPSVSRLTLLPLLWLASFYLAGQGMLLAGRFVVMAFIGSVWIAALFIQFLFPPAAEYRLLLPVFPKEPRGDLALILPALWAALSGPQYLAFAGRRFAPAGRMFRWLALGNALTVLEYIVFFLAVTLSFGTEYMRKIDYPVVQLIRYIQLPFFERLETVVIPAHMILYVFLDAFFILFLRDALRVAAGAARKPERPGWLTAAAFLWVAVVYVIGRFFWTNETQHRLWIHVHVWLAGALYALVPSFLALAAARRRRRSDRTLT